MGTEALTAPHGHRRRPRSRGRPEAGRRARDIWTKFGGLGFGSWGFRALGLMGQKWLRVSGLWELEL